jgi:hypothetical protein
MLKLKERGASGAVEEMLYSTISWDVNLSNSFEQHRRQYLDCSCSIHLLF